MQTSDPLELASRLGRDLSRFLVRLFFERVADLGVVDFAVYFVRHIEQSNSHDENGVFLDLGRSEPGVEAIEAAFLLLKYEFEYLNLQKIVGEVLAQNTRALRFNESLGMIREGVRRRHVYFDGEFHDLVLFALFRDDFFQRPTAIIRSFIKSSAGASPPAA